MIKHQKLSAQERDKIAVWLAGGLSLRQISRQLNRSVSSISVEVRRNSFKGEYRSITAQHLSWERNLKSRRTNPLYNAGVLRIDLSLLTVICFGAAGIYLTIEWIRWKKSH